MAKYILNKTGYMDVKNILYLSASISPDYLRCITLHGFKELFGDKCHDYPKIPHIYKSNDIDYTQLYGKGITYTNLLEPELHNDELDSTIEEDIQNKKYDIVIYGSYHRGMLGYDIVSKYYNPNEIILLCRTDGNTWAIPRLSPSFAKKQFKLSDEFKDDYKTFIEPFIGGGSV